MSYILAYADTNRVVVAGDGREMDEYGTTISNKIHRVKRLNKNVAIGFVGNLAYCRQVVEETKMALAAAKGKPLSSVSEVAGHLQAVATALYQKEYGICSFVLGGAREDGTPVLTAMCSENEFSAIRRIPDPDSAQTICLCPYASDIPVEKILSHNLEGILPRKEAYQYAFTKTLQETTKGDSRIGGKITVEIVVGLS